MSLFRYSLLISVLLLACLSGAAFGAWYVAPNGNDQWSGSLASPNNARTDGPFATLQRAQDSVRTYLQANPNRKEPVVVYLRGGTYYLASPIVFKPEDSGTAQSPVIYTAYGKEQPVISGGTPLTGLTVTGKQWQIQLPSVAQGQWNFTELFVNGERRFRPRLPKTGYSFVEKAIPPTAEEQAAFQAAREAMPLPAYMQTVTPAAGTRANRNRRLQRPGGQTTTPGTATATTAQPSTAQPVVPTAGVQPNAQRSNQAQAPVRRFTMGYNQFRFAPGAMSAKWHNVKDIEVMAFLSWAALRTNIDSINDTDRTVTLKGRTRGGGVITNSYIDGSRYLIDNVREALSDPGEWYLDRTDGTLTYLPKPGENIERAEVIAPKLDQLVLYQGDVEGRKWVQFVDFKGITFSHTNWTMPPSGNYERQAEAGLSAALSGVGARNCAIEDCTVNHVGAYGIEFGPGCQDDIVQRCRVYDLGAGGIKVGTQSMGTDEEACVNHVILRNNIIAQGGRMHPAGVGVWVAQAANNIVEHNDIGDFYYSGISEGWSGGYRETWSRDNLISYNHVHEIGQGVLSDMGGIYTEGLVPGDLIQNNLVHGVSRFAGGYGGWGIYLDDGTSEVLVQNNIVYDTLDPGYHLHYGMEDRVINNIFAFGKEGAICRTNGEEQRSLDYSRNIVLINEGPVLTGDWRGSGYNFDNNLYWDTRKVSPIFETLTENLNWAGWQSHGQDQHSLFADPLFVNAARADFRLKPGSPAEKIGFVPIDMSTVGPMVKLAPVPAAPRAFPVLQHPDPVMLTFEHDVRVTMPSVGSSTTSSDESLVPASTEQAHGGQRSLKLTPEGDASTSGLSKYGLDLFFQEGSLSGEFSVYLTPGAVFSHEWHDYPGKYFHVGPSVSIKQDGTLVSGGRTLGTVPFNKWLTFDISATRDEQRMGRYHLQVSGPGMAGPLVFDDLQSDPYFTTFRWTYFGVTGKPGSAAYVDDVKFTLK